MIDDPSHPPRDDEPTAALPPRLLPLTAALDRADPGAGPILDMHASGGSAHEMTSKQIRDVRAMLLRDHFAFSYLIAGNRDLYPAVHGPLSQMMERWGQEGWRRLMVQVPRSAFKCLAVGHLVDTPSGPQAVETLRAGDTVQAIDSNGKLTTATVLANRVATASLVRVTTRSGLAVSCTPNHPLYQFNGWTPADQLKPGDWVGTPRQVTPPAKSYSNAYFAGVLIGDGCLRWNNQGRVTPTITCHDNEILDALRARGIMPVQRQHKYTFSFKAEDWGPLPVSMWTKSLDKSIPSYYEGSGDFLRGLFDTDGTVGHHVINLTTASSQLAKDVQRNLRYFGIVARKYEYESQGLDGFRGRMWHVNIAGPVNAALFQKHIGFEIRRKQEALKTLTRARVDRTDLIPPEWRTKLIKGRSGGTLQDRRPSDELRLRRDGIRIDNKYATNRLKLAKAADILQYSWMWEAVRSDIWWDQIKSIEPIGEGQIAELEVSGNHSYLAEGLIHHNTSHLTIAGILWKVCQDPNTTIACFNEKVQRVERWFLALQNIVAGNDLFQVIFPDITPPGLSRRDRAAGRTLPKSWKWSSQEMNFNRTDWTLKEPTLTALGVGAASAGGHYQWCFFDDLISEEARKSPIVMQGAKEWLDTAKYLGMTEASWNAFMACTRWAYDDLYEYACSNHGFHLYRRAAIEDGASFWPERYPIESLLRDQAKNPASFSAQMLNDPVAGTDLAFDGAWLRTCTLTHDEFDEPIIEIPPDQYTPHATVIPDSAPPRRIRLSQCSKILLVDPAPSSETERRQQPSARTGMVLKVRDPWGRRFKIDAWAGREDPIPEVRRMLDMMRLYNCDRIAVEEVVFSKLYKSIIELVCDRHYDGWRPRYIALKPKGRDKDTRISGKRGDYQAGMEYMVPALDALWRAEYLTYPYSKTRDLLDAEAYDKDPGVLPRPETNDEVAEAEYWQQPQSRTQLGADPITGY